MVYLHSSMLIYSTDRSCIKIKTYNSSSISVLATTDTSANVTDPAGEAVL